MVSISTINKITQNMQQRGRAGKFGRTGGANGSIFGGVNRTGTNLNARPVASAGSANSAGGASAAKTGGAASDGTIKHANNYTELQEIINSGAKVQLVISGSNCGICKAATPALNQAAANLEGSEVIVVQIDLNKWPQADQKKIWKDVKTVKPGTSSIQYPAVIEYNDGKPTKFTQRITSVTGKDADKMTTFFNGGVAVSNNNTGGVCVGPDCEDKEPCVGPGCNDTAAPAPSTSSTSSGRARIWSTSSKFR